MSVILRAKAQPILDKYGLENAHTIISEGSRQLCIVTSCGRPLVRISGITFSRIAPSATEIDHALEFLGTYLENYADSLVDLQNLQDEVKCLSKKIEKAKDQDYLDTRSSFQHSDVAEAEVGGKGDFKFVWSHSLKGFCLSGEFSKVLAKDIPRIQGYKEIIAKARTLQTMLNKRYELSTKLSKLQTKLNSCSL